MRSTLISAIVGVGLAIWPAAALAGDMGHTIMKAGDLKWAPFDPNQPDGIQVAVVMGDPSKPAPFVMRARFPAGLTVPSHNHSTDELITVLSGKAMISWGIKTDIAQGDALEPGTFFYLKGGEHHTLKTVEPTEVEIHAMGPFDMKIDE